MMAIPGTIALNLTPYWHFSGVLHPAVAHFPIALLIVAAVVEAWSVVRRHRKPLPTALVCLYLGTAAAVVATVLGWANADASGEKGTTLNWHRWLGVAVAALALVSVMLSLFARRETAGAGMRWLYRGAVFAGAALVGLVGSFGGKLVHGDTYYDDALATLQEELASVPAHISENATQHMKNATAKVADAAQVVTKVPGTIIPSSKVPANGAAQPGVASPTTAPSADAVVASAGGQIDYDRDIHPIFEDRCISCHNEKKKKGDYRLDTVAHVFAAGESGKVPVIPGKSDDSHLVKLIEGKGEYEDSIMPPKGKPLTFQEISIIRQWIDDGAKVPTN
jgi:uncharacterized membrane protein